MSTLAVRPHLPVATSLRLVRDEEAARGQVPGPSVRALLAALRGYELELAPRAHWSEHQVVGLSQLLDTVEQVTGRSLRSGIRLRLEVWVDGEYERSLRVTVRGEGQASLEGDRRIAFHTRIELRWYEETVAPALAHPTVSRLLSVLPLPDPVLTTVVHGQPRGRSRLTFTGRVGRFEIDHAVTERLPRPPTARELIAGFEAVETAGVWSHVTRPQVAADLRQALEEPHRIRQGPTPLCGPASVLYALAKRAPRRYVRAVTTLFEEGRFATKSGTIGTTASLRAAPVPVSSEGSRPREADWIISAAMRNDENLLFRVESDNATAADIAGITLSGPIITWTRELLGYEDITVELATSTGRLGIKDLPVHFGWVIAGLDTITGRSASAALASGGAAMSRGGEAFVLVNHTMLNEVTYRTSGTVRDGSKKDVPDLLHHVVPQFATHWIALRRPGGPIGFSTGDPVVFDAFTWGDYVGVEVPASRAERDVFLVVTAHEGPPPPP